MILLLFCSLFPIRGIYSTLCFFFSFGDFLSHFMKVEAIPVKDTKASFLLSVVNS